VLEDHSASENLHTPFRQCLEGSCFELGSATEIGSALTSGGYEYNAYNGYAADSASYYSAATSPCVLSAFKATLKYGQGYFYTPHGGVGWCRSIDRDHIANVQQAYEDGAWTGGAPDGITYLPIGNDDAAVARCNTTLEGLIPGKISCRASQLECLASDGWKSIGSGGSGDCFTDGVGGSGTRLHCPDGLGPNGVYVTNRLYSSEETGYCAAWDSSAAARGFMDCAKDKKTCTKILAYKAHMMSPSTGILMMKRFKCTDDGCKVFKVGKCFDVTPSVPFKNCIYKHYQDGCVYVDAGGYRADALEADTKAFAALVVQQMKDGKEVSCTGADLALAEAYIKMN